MPNLPANAPRPMSLAAALGAAVCTIALLVAPAAPARALTPPLRFQTLQVENPGPSRWWQDAVVYEVWPRSFKDDDGDGNGDFKGLTSKLDYLQGLGVKAIWLTPVFEAPSYHGYDFQDFHAIERDYGRMADFERFVAEAHRRGIKVILDLVLNHVSDQHPWFLASVKRVKGYEDAFVWRKTRPEGWGQAWSDAPAPEKVWHWNAERGEYYYGAFDASQPDLNLRNPAVAGELDAVAAFWLKKGVDGFRLDAVRYAIEDGPLSGQADTPETIAFWTAFAKKVRAIDPDALLIGEAWAPLETVGRYRNGGQGLDAAFDFDFGETVIALLDPRSERKADFGTVDDAAATGGREALWANLQARAAAAPLSYFAPFLSNHDQNRLLQRLGGDVSKAKVAASLLLTSPGTPFLYYGEEIGLSQPTIGEDRYRRAPMQWDDGKAAGFNTTGKVWTDRAGAGGYRGPQGAWWGKYWKAQRGSGTSVAEEDATPGSLLRHYRALLAMRNATPALRKPDELRWYPVDAAEVWVLRATSAEGDNWVVINLDPAKPVEFGVPPELQGERRDRLGEATKRLGERFTLQPGETLVF